jgi:trimeric autotransporter adhesin
MTLTAAVVSLLLTTTPHPETATSDLAGRVVFGGAGVPGAIVTAIHGERSVGAVSGDDGTFRLANLEDGTWTLRIEMRGFVPVNRELSLPLAEPALILTLTMRPYDEIVGRAPQGASAAAPIAAASPQTEPPDAPDIINGSTINGAASAFAQPRAFGNNRPATSASYTGAVSAIIGNSAWNAAPYSFGGSTAPAPSYGDVQLGFTLGGPMRIPWLVRNGPNMFLSYQHNLTHNVSTQSASMPTAAERGGDFSQSTIEIRDPLTGQPFAGNVIPADRISPPAEALLAYYPLPNGAVTGGPNYQTAVLSAAKEDAVQFAVSQAVTRRDTVGGSLSFRHSVTDATTLFNFEDESLQSSLNASVNWTRRLSTRLSTRFRYQLTRTATGLTPFFANRINVSGDAGISGNDQQPVNWGPPTLSLPDVAGLSDGVYQRAVATAHAANGEILLRRGPHNITVGGDFRRNGYDVQSHPNPRGTLAFTGALTGDAFADFLLGVPATSSIAYGDEDSHLRGNAYDAYANDDWRMSPGVTLNLGVRWEYEAPFTETSGRLVNLDVAPGFTAVSPVLATDPVGTLTGAEYPTSLIRPDKRSVEPRLAGSWRPVLGSSLVIRGSYGLYRNLGVYQPLALLLAQQPPLSTTFSIRNSLQTPLTLANPFPASIPGTPNTYAIDPGFRPGYAQSWSASAQRDLPASLTVIAAYLGTKGSQLMQAFLPNTYPTGTPDPCLACPSGFVYVTSNGSSLRNAAQFTVRRRLHNGLTASVQYTLAKSTDDAATFSNSALGPSSLAIAQNWLDLGAERGPSVFDQRHLVAVQFQYTTGVGVTGGTLIDGPWGTIFKDWTITAQLSAGSGLPFTPVSFLAVAGTGVVGVRPRLTGVSPEPTTSGSYANPAAYAAPLPGTWGDAGRNSSRGPAQFSLDMSVARVFRMGARFSLEWSLAATNVLNRVTYSTIDPVVTSPQFGLPTLANPMRQIHTALRWRF